MSADPAVTVLMAVYNGGRLLAEAIRSILSQGFCEYEFLIIDDASSDGSVSVLQDFAAKDTRIRLLLNEVNKGQTACLNQGLREAKGKWIARQDADDLSLPGRLELQWKSAQRTPDLMIVGVNGWVIDELGACTGMIHAPLIDQGIRWSLPFRNPFIHAGVMFRRRWPDGSAVLYDEGFQICQDWDLWTRLLEKGEGMNLPQRLVAYRHQDGSLSHGNLEKTRREMERITARIWSKSYPKHEPNQELLSSFREGLDSQHQGDFWCLYEALRKEWEGKQISQAMAVHRLQAAGALGVRNPGAMMIEVLRALAAEPIWTIKTLRDGVFRPKRITA